MASSGPGMPSKGMPSIRARGLSAGLGSARREEDGERHNEKKART